MTIDLGFAWMDLPTGEHVSLVDAPGHERFIKNMLAGVGGIDLALLVIAADEGVMPQTREHTAILDLLGIRSCVIALTKSDLVEKEWLALVQDDVRESLKETALREAPIVAVSSTSGEGIPELITQIGNALESIPSRKDQGQPRLPIDRVFSIGGFGTVVTGTLMDGTFHLGDEVEIMPQGVRSRVRGLQTHQTNVDEALPGSRVAINLVSLTPRDVQRGNVAGRPGALKATGAVDVKLRLIPGAIRGLKNNDEVSFFSGTSEVLGRVTLLEGVPLEPGNEGWVRLKLAKPLAISAGDRFIVRIPSPSATIGGGVISDIAPRLQRKFRAQTLRWLEALESGSADNILIEALGDRPIARRAVLDKTRFTIGDEQAEKTVHQLIDAEQALELDSHLISSTGWRDLSASVAHEVADYHERFPLRAGMPREELRSRLDLPAKPFQAAIRRWVLSGILIDRGSAVSAAGFGTNVSAEQQAKLDQAVAALQAQPYSPPSENQLALNPEELTLLISQQGVIRISGGQSGERDVIFDRRAYDSMVTGTVEYLQEHSKISVGEFRDLFHTSRRYALPFLGHLDERKITRRVGEDRVLGPAGRRLIASVVDKSA